MKSLIIQIILVLLIPSFSSIPCTAFSLSDSNTVFLAKNLDWPIGDGYILVNPRGLEKTGQCNTPLKPIHWTSKYGSVTFNMLGKNFPLGGINEKGLVVEELSYSPSIYQPNEDVPTLNELQWIQYQLDNYSTVEEVLNNINKLQISKLLFGLHYFLTDSLGNSAAVEFIDGKILVYNGGSLPYPILVNNSYSNSLKNLYQHEGFGGKHPIHKANDSPTRFVRVAKFHSNNKSDNSVEEVFRILNDVKQNDTQWSIVYDVSDKEISFSTKGNTTKRFLDINEIKFEKIDAVKYLAIEDRQHRINILEQFSLLTYEMNENLLDHVVTKLVLLKELNSDAGEKLKDTIMSYY